MTQEELKNIILTHVNLDEYRKAEIEYFFSECDGITAENYQDKLLEWRKSKSGTDASGKIEKDLSTKQDASIQKGLTAIQRGDYSVLENTRRLGTFVVKNSETGYFGLITESREEILPCIFNSVNVCLDGFIKAGFKGLYMNPTHNFKFCDKSFALELANDGEDGFTFGEDGGFFLLREEMDERTTQLIDLIKINHSFHKNGE